MCSERTSYRFALSADGTALTGRLTAIGFETWEGQKVPKSVVGYSTTARVGDTLTLHVAGHGLLSTRWPLTHPLKKMLLEGPGEPVLVRGGHLQRRGPLRRLSLPRGPRRRAPRLTRGCPPSRHQQFVPVGVPVV